MGNISELRSSVMGTMRDATNSCNSVDLIDDSLRTGNAFLTWLLLVFAQCRATRVPS